MITDSKGMSAFLITGAAPRGSAVKPVNTAQLGAWIAQKQVFHALLRLTRNPDERDIWVSWKHVRTIQPFGIDEGECLYDTKSLFSYAGKRGKDSGNVLMVLWSFPEKLQARKRGHGRLNPGPAAGGLVDGDITWDIVAVNSPVEDRVGDWDMAMRAMTMTVDPKTAPF
jgi:hypothetical protein